MKKRSNPVASCFHAARVIVPTLLALLAASALVGVAPSIAAPVRTEHVEAELVAGSTALVPNQPLTVALRLKMEPGWHTYWQNPGDSGLPTRIEWKLPAGVTAGPIQWATPLALPAGPLINYGYEGEVLLLTDLQSSLPATGEPVTLAARADWLVCKEMCIPEGVDLTLSLPTAASAGPDVRWGDKIAAAKAALPKPLEGWEVSAHGNGATIDLRLVPTVDAARAAPLKDLRFFSFAEGQIEPGPPQNQRREGDAVVLTLPVSTALSGGFTRLAGVVTAQGGSGAVRAATIDVPLAGTVGAGSKRAAAATPQLNASADPLPQPVQSPSSDRFTLLAAVLFAFIGGVLLNLMPCVFPVLSIKVLGFATHHDSKATMRREAVAFSAGVVLTFVALGLVLALLRAAGQQLGWGFQLQSPAVVTALAVLFFALALNLSGVFEFGQLVPSGKTNWSSENRTVDAFGSGVLVVVIASPCTAPFMGAALGYALSASAFVTAAVFVALGVGMALPYALLAWFPGWRKRLPKPGAWLVQFKQLLAFPMYATVIWLAWVLGSQRDNDAVLRLLAVLLCVGFALWAWRIVKGGGSRPWAIVGFAVLAVSAVLAWPLLATDADAIGATAGNKASEPKAVAASA
jgi:thiol:disulfide interchange protein DsbD